MTVFGAHVMTHICRMVSLRQSTVDLIDSQKQTTPGVEIKFNGQTVIRMTIYSRVMYCFVPPIQSFFQFASPFRVNHLHLMNHLNENKKAHQLLNATPVATHLKATAIGETRYLNRPFQNRLSS